MELDDRYGYIDLRGKVVIPIKYTTASDFSEGLAVVELEEYGFINKQGRMVIPPIYDDADSFSEGLAAIELNGWWGYIDKKGTLVIPPKYLRADPFFKGFGWAESRTNGWTYIDHTGYEFGTDMEEALRVRDVRQRNLSISSNSSKK